jgi:hypothetical protein
MLGWSPTKMTQWSLGPWPHALIGGVQPIDMAGGPRRTLPIRGGGGQGLQTRGSSEPPQSPPSTPIRSRGWHCQRREVRCLHRRNQIATPTPPPAFTVSGPRRSGHDAMVASNSSKPTGLCLNSLSPSPSPSLFCALWCSTRFIPNNKELPTRSTP